MNWNNFTPYFKQSEFTCKCGCGTNNIDERTMDKLLQARLSKKVVEANIVFKINSGCRCIAHNKAVKGSKGSSHVTGYAIDMRIRSNSERYIILNALRKVGFRRFGIGKNMLHCDNDPNKSKNIIWVY